VAPPERILFVSSNGTGLGHLTRSMAIARRLGPEVESLFVTFSRAAPVVRDVGFPVEFIASHGSPAAGSDFRWSRRLAGRLGAVVAEVDPRVLVFDGVLPYDPLLAAMRPVPATVWCRRGLWRPGASTAPLTRADLFDAVLEPGDFGAAADRGPTSARRDEVYEVSPIVFLDDAEVLPRADAERELGLEPGTPTVLVQLGQGEEVAATTDRCLRALAARNDVQVAAASSAIAGLLDVPEGVVHLRSTYPMSRYYAAFDGAVAAAGYNAFHELIRFGVPALFVPMPRDTDDQAARARHAERMGIAVAVDAPGDERLEERLAELADPQRREAMRQRLRELRPANGAAEAAQWLEQMATIGEPAGGGWGGASAGGDEKAEEQGLRRSAKRRPMDGEGLLGTPADDSSAAGRVARAWVFVKTLPRTVTRLVRQTLTLPRPRTLILALGAGAQELERGITEALQEVEPERALVVTDSLEIRDVWRLGVGLEHIPASGERQAELAGVDYPAFARRRLELILAHRPRPRRVIAVGDVPDELRQAALARGRNQTRDVH
jgi:UDP:flavonoid glycosyltransferase YjiC (YdhE family)